MEGEEAEGREAGADATTGGFRDDLSERDWNRFREAVSEVREAKADYINRVLEQADARREWLKAEGYPLVGLAGHGRCGKDTAGEILANEFGLRFTGSISSVMAPLIAHSLGCSAEDAYYQRHNYRHYWYHFCNGFRLEDPSIMIRMTYFASDIVSGIRSEAELTAAKENGLLDYVLWIENPGNAEDPTIEYDGNHECIDMSVMNYKDSRFDSAVIKAYQFIQDVAAT